MLAVLANQASKAKVLKNIFSIDLESSSSGGVGRLSEGTFSQGRRW